MIATLIIALTLALSFALTALVRRYAVRRGVLDLPNERSSHSAPTPRGAGLAIVLASVAGLLLLAIFRVTELRSVLVLGSGMLVVAAIGWLDDHASVPPRVRLTVHTVAAVLTVVALRGLPALRVGAGAVHLGAFGALVAVLGIVWSINLFNFMDGIDGLAGTMGAMGFAAYAVASACGVQASPAGIRSAPAFAALAAAMLPFLAVNLPPARMFLGDVGAVPLGYLAAAFGAAGVGEKLWAPWFPVLVFLPFVADASLTLARRIARGERLWEGHRGHYYQRLAQLCAGHAGALGVYACVMGGTALTAVLCHAGAPRAGWWALAAWCVVLIMMFAAIDYHWHKKTGIPSPR